LQDVTDGPQLRIGLYDAYLSTLGGGENLLAVLAECLEREFPRARLELLTHPPEGVGVPELMRRFGVDLRRTTLRLLPTRNRAWTGPWTPLRRVLDERDIARVTAEYDLFVNQTIFSMVPTRSRHSIYVCMFPLDPVPWALRGRRDRLGRLAASPYVALRRAVFRRFLRRYDLLLGISEYTRSWIRRFWRLDSTLLYPPAETEAELHLQAKRRRILSIGRFFPGDHNKKHGVMIDAFNALSHRGIEDWELHLVGGWTDVAGTGEYVEDLRRRAGGRRIHFHVDCSRERLRELLRTSSIFWHATGYGEDEVADPYKLEHFGVSTVEAMTHGCVPLVHDSGGQKEILEDGRSGFLWRRREELEAKTLDLVRNPALRDEMARHAHLRSQLFGREAFQATVRRLLAEVLPLSWLRDGVGAVDR
jgi:glycosyltransferase involved in cell wall biosynthesis